MENQEAVNTPPALPQENKTGSCKLPGFVMGFVIADLVFCFVRIFIALLSIVGMVGISRTSPIFYSGMFEILFNSMIVIFGLSGNILILCKKPLGVKLAYINIMATIGGMLVGIWQVLSMFDTGDKAKFIGAIIGLLMMVMARSVILGFYWNAISKAKAFFAKCADTNPV